MNSILDSWNDPKRFRQFQIYSPDELCDISFYAGEAGFSEIAFIQRDTSSLGGSLP
jgi:hypothetical protein